MGAGTSAASPGPVLVIPGGAFQVDLIRKARSRGYHVICADQRADCPGATAADEFHCIGLDRREGLLALAQARQVRGVLTDQTDSGVATAAWLSLQLGLAGIGTDAAALYTRKPLMRAFSLGAGFPTPPSRPCSDPAGAHRAAAELGYPVVVKPPAAQSSKGVARVANPATLGSAFAAARRYSDDGTVLVETYIDGPEYTVEGFRTAGGHRTLAISEKRHYARCPMVACALRYRPWYGEGQLGHLERQHDRWVDSSGLALGMTHAEYRLMDGQFYLIEIAARGGGSGIASAIVPWVSGIDYQEWLLDAVVERRAVPRHERRAQRCALLEFLDLPDGVVQSVRGVEAARRVPGVCELEVGCVPGTPVRAPGDDTTRPGRFVLRADTDAELEQSRRLLLAVLQVSVTG